MAGCKKGLGFEVPGSGAKSGVSGLLLPTRGFEVSVSDQSLGPPARAISLRAATHLISSLHVYACTFSNLPYAQTYIYIYT